MSEVKSFTGFIAIDGTTHTNKTAAIAHTRDVKVRAALAELGPKIIKEGAAGVQMADEGFPFIDSDTFADFIMANQAEITKALNQEVRLRKSGAGRPKKAKTETPAPVAA